MIRYIFLSVFALLLLTACSDGLTDQTEGKGPGMTPTSKTGPETGKDVAMFSRQPSPQSCQECDLRAADLSGSDLSDADLVGANLWGANLKGANLVSANLTEVDLEDALLQEANLSGADLSGAKLFLANLSGADLSGANFNKADLFGAHLDGVIGADFSGALNVPEYTKGLKMVGP